MSRESQLQTARTSDWQKDESVRKTKRIALGLVAGAMAYALITATLGTWLPIWWGVPCMSLTVGVGAAGNWKFAGPLLAGAMAYVSLDFAQNLENTMPLYGFIAATVTGLVCSYKESN